MLFTNNYILMHLNVLMDSNENGLTTMHSSDFKFSTKSFNHYEILEKKLLPFILYIPTSHCYLPRLSFANMPPKSNSVLNCRKKIKVNDLTTIRFNSYPFVWLAIPTFQQSSHDCSAQGIVQLLSSTWPILETLPKA